MCAVLHPARRENGWRVLVVDAERDLVDRVLRNAERCGQAVAAVRVARAGAEAIPLARDLQPDLLLLDPDLPDGDGWALLQPILRDAPRCAAVIVTRRVAPEDIKMAMAYGARGYLVKPIGARNIPPQTSGCIVSVMDILSDLLAPAPPSGPGETNLAHGQ